MFGLDAGMTLVLVICIFAACCFEFINGFHDTANAVATVIYTNSMKPTVAVIWSGICNFLGVLVGGIAVAMGIVNLLPLSILIDQSVAHSIAMIAALILTAILWNLGTWYFGIPCSSSHTLLGSIFGVGLAYGFLPHVGVIALNWQKVKDVFLFLLISPLIGFAFTMAVVLLVKQFVKYKKLFHEPVKKKAPPFWIRGFLILTSTGLSFTHGQNDGQKGVGLLMIILIALVPVHFAVDHTMHPDKLMLQANNIETVLSKVDPSGLSASGKASLGIIKEKIDTMQSTLTGVGNFKNLKKESNFEIRKDILIIAKESSKILSPDVDDPILKLSKEDKVQLKDSISEMKKFTEYAPLWVILLISISLGLGTMIGWKRIVVTIGEKIGKEHMNYAQGASANLVTAITIGVSSSFGLPVSTTHILSSGVAGSMFATHGIKNLRMKMIKSIMIAWLVTLPVTILLSGSLFLLFRLFCN
ncbi:MAG: inorganic phosphate transporter [Bacteroidota bacterium]|nr:inorganic phosphate transporter [Bacteroidota bacterium]